MTETERTVPVICMECGKEFKRVPECENFPGAPSHGYCPACLPVVETRWFGGKLGGEKGVTA